MRLVIHVPLPNFLQKTCFIQMNSGSAEYLLASRILETLEWIPWTTPLHLVASIYSAWNLYPSSFTLCTSNHIATKPVSPCSVTLCSLNKTLNASKLHEFKVHLLMIMCSNNYVLSYSNATINISMFQTLHFLLSRWNTSAQCTEPITLITSHH
jgi:hypothetical protein